MGSVPKTQNKKWLAKAATKILSKTVFTRRREYPTLRHFKQKQSL